MEESLTAPLTVWFGQFDVSERQSQTTSPALLQAVDAETKVLCNDEGVVITNLSKKIRLQILGTGGQRPGAGAVTARRRLSTTYNGGSNQHGGLATTNAMPLPLMREQPR